MLQAPFIVHVLNVILNFSCLNLTLYFSCCCKTDFIYLHIVDNFVLLCKSLHSSYQISRAFISTWIATLFYAEYTAAHSTNWFLFVASRIYRACISENRACHYWSVSKSPRGLSFNHHSIEIGRFDRLQLSRASWCSCRHIVLLKEEEEGMH